jgi:hypothetical protein
MLSQHDTLWFVMILALVAGCGADDSPADRGDPDPDRDAGEAEFDASVGDGDAGSPATCPSSGQACSKRDGLIARYDFEELSDGTAPVPRDDATACDHDLPDTNSVPSTDVAHGGRRAARPTYVPDVLGTLDREDSPSLSVFHDGHSYTIAAWFQILQGAPASGKIIIKGIGTSSGDPIREFGLEYQHCPPPDGCPDHATTTDHLHYGVFDSDPGGTAAVLDIPPSDFDPREELGEWVFVMLWRDDATETMYIQLNDGTLYSRSTAGVTIRDTGAPLKIGGLVQAFDGIVDDVMIWNRVLTPAERTSVFTSGLDCPSR